MSTLSDQQPQNRRVGVWQVRWRNPYTPRPEGFPEVFLRIEVPLAKGQGAGHCPSEIDEAWEEMRMYGYGVSWHLEAPPVRQLPLASKQRLRRLNVWKRMLKRYPMFCSDFYAEKIQSNPDHYGTYIAGEFADLVFARTTLGNLKQVRL